MPEPGMKITEHGPVFFGLDKDSGAKLCFLLLRSSLVFLDRLQRICPDREAKEIISKSLRVREDALSGLNLDCPDARIDKICSVFQVLFLNPLLEEDIFVVISGSRAAICNMFKLVMGRDRAVFKALADGGFGGTEIFGAVDAADDAAFDLLCALFSGG